MSSYCLPVWWERKREKERERERGGREREVHTAYSWHMLVHTYIHACMYIAIFKLCWHIQALHSFFFSNRIVTWLGETVTVTAVDAHTNLQAVCHSPQSPSTNCTSIVMSVCSREFSMPAGTIQQQNNVGKGKWELGRETIGRFVWLSMLY